MSDKGNAMRADGPQFGRLAVDPEMVKRWGNAMASMPGAVVDAIERLMTRGYEPGQEDSQAVHDAAIAASALFAGGGARAASGAASSELGITGSKLLQRSDAIKLMRDLRAKGATYEEVTQALRDRFGPIIDENAPLNQRMVVGRGQRTNDTFELGSFGGRGRAPGEPDTLAAFRGVPEFEQLSDQLFAQLKTRRAGTVDAAAKTATELAGPYSSEGMAISALRRGTNDAALGDIAEHMAAYQMSEGVTRKKMWDWLRAADIPIDNIKTPEGGTTYFKVRDMGGERMEVRVPLDAHVGKPGRGGKTFDTGEMVPGDIKNGYIDPRTTKNASGEPYSNFDVLTDALKYETGKSPDGQFLVAPGREPNFRNSRNRPAPEPVPEASNPDQLRLLSSGVPIPAGDGGARFANPSAAYIDMTENDAGRFANRNLSPTLSMNTPATISHANAMLDQPDAPLEPMRYMEPDRYSQLPAGFILDEPNTTTVPKTRNAMRAFET